MINFTPAADKKNSFFTTSTLVSLAHQRKIGAGNAVHGSDGMSCNNAPLITQTVSEVVTHYTGYYTAKNRKKCPNYTTKHKFQGSLFEVLGLK